MAEVFQKSGRSCVSGTEVLRWRISFPRCGEGIASFYEKVGERVAQWCEGELRTLAEQEFEACEDPNKRFSFPALSYRCEGRVSYEDESYLSVCLAAELRCRGERAPRSSFEDGQVWEKASAQMLSPEQVVALFCEQKLSRKERSLMRGVLLSEKCVLWYDGNHWNKKEFLTKE